MQTKTIPVLLKGSDLIGAAKSGTGKTAAFVLPILEKLKKTQNNEPKVLRCVILVPTRELAKQISKAVSHYSRHLNIKYAEIFGGVSNKIQETKLNKGVDIIVATTGRLKDHITNNGLNLSSVNMIVVDEADTMLELGFLKDIEEVLSLVSPQRQIMMFSATISQNVKQLAKKFLRTPTVVEITNRRETVALIDHLAYSVDSDQKKEMLSYLIGSKNYQQLLVFVNTKKMADTLTEHLNLDGLNSLCIHGDIKQPARARALRKFKAGEIRVLIATDIAARGIDIEQLPIVVNYSLPETTDDFTHRIGRTGRAGNKGCEISLLCVKEYKLYAQIQKDLKLDTQKEQLEGFELTQKEHRVARFKRLSLSEKKGLRKVKNPYEKKVSKTKKTTKRDANRTFRKK
ncbi:MAG: DEAD/DEAH box helicase [Campylobacteraceae bacterium]|nr:DEAD/DEAH box helicase [Campylobacteraceae bacterium]